MGTRGWYVGTHGLGDWLSCNPGASLGQDLSPPPPCGVTKRQFCVCGETEAKASCCLYSMSCESVGCMARKARDALGPSLVLTRSGLDLN